MFRFWTSETRGSDRTSDGHLPGPDDCGAPLAPRASELPTPISPVQPFPQKRRRPSSVDTTFDIGGYPPAKRARTLSHDNGLPSPISAAADGEDMKIPRKRSMELDIERAKDAIQYQFGLETLLKHDELRLINQELAKCQVALEQLRRCHLIPYPVQCPTPSQMLDISSGKGPALQPRSGQPVPKWAPPFGVVEGPYARHYAKWLIPDPVFDGMQLESQGFYEAGRTKSAAAEGRTTRNSMTDAGAFGKQRPVRGQSGQRLQALSSGYPQPKDKQAPCVVKRSDGVTVKLVCIDCHRWDFSSTQGFINHCRIAHRRDFKSHEEAAVHSGHPIEAEESGAAPPAEESKVQAPVASGLTHPLARNEPTSEQEAYKSLTSRIRAALDLYNAGHPPKSSSTPKTAVSKSQTAKLVTSSDAPYLSQLMQKKKLGGNLTERVNDAKTRVDWDLLSPEEDSDVDQQNTYGLLGSNVSSAVRTPAVMRVPARSAVPSSPPTSAARPVSSKGRVVAHLGVVPHVNSIPSEIPETPTYDDDMDVVDLSPNTIASNNAPSLVSDDGEYDDSDDGSASDTSDDVESESVSDVAEINIAEDADVQDVTPRPIHHCRPASAAVKLRKDEPRHVTFVAPIATKNAKNRRKQKN